MPLEPFEFDFRPRRPEGEMARFVEAIWYARGTVPYARENIAPTGSTVAVVVLGDPIVQTPDNGEGPPLRAQRGFLVGPHDRPGINQPTGETFAVGVVTTPVGCQACFGVQPAQLRARIVELESSWSHAADLRAALVEIDDPEQMLDRVEALLGETIDASVPGLERCERAVAMLEADPTRAIADIADELEVSHGHLDRELTRVVGLTPRVLSRLLRVRRLLGRLDVREDVSWSALAAEHGWFDQAHFIRDFKRHTGATPTAYLAAQRATFSEEQAEAAAGFVPRDDM